MLAGLPLAAYLLLLTAFVRRGQDVRSAALHAATAWGVLAVVMTEALSLTGKLTRAGLGMVWFAIALASLAAIFWAAAKDGDRCRVGEWRPRLGRLPLAEIGLLLGAGVIVALVGVVAVLGPPNSWDAMQYHLPRVVRWIEYRSVGFYPTHELKQLLMAPGAEFLLLQVHALWGGDRLDNLLQWGAFLGSVVGVTAIARCLGAGPRGQALAAVICATLPEGILGASGAKNDCVLSFWLVSLAYYALTFRERPGWFHAAGLGSALGLAWLTKGTGYAFALPILLVLVTSWSRLANLAFLKRVPLVLLLALGLNAGHFARNYGLSGLPLGPGVEEKVLKYTNDTISPSAVMSNVVRNVALHIRSEQRAANAAIERWLEPIIRGMGADPDDPRTNFFSFERFRLPEVQRREGFAGNPVHLLLALVTLVILCGSYRSDRHGVAVYTLALLLSFAVFCALLKWQPLHARLHLPLFVLGSAAIGVVMERAWPTLATRAVAAILVVLAVLLATGNVTRSLMPRAPFNVLKTERDHLYFGDRAGVEGPYRAAVSFLRTSGCRHIGLDLSTGVGSQYEYPLLALLKEGEQRQVHPVGVTNGSAVYGPDPAPFRPCAVVCVHCARAKWNEYASAGSRVSVFEDIAVFLMPGSGFHAGRHSVEGAPQLSPRSAQRLRGLLAKLPDLVPESPPPPGARATAVVLPSATRVHAGMEFRLAVRAANPQRVSPVAVSVGVLLPDRQGVRFVLAPGLVGEAVGLAQLSAVEPLWVLEEGAELKEVSLVKFMIPATVPPGLYHWFVVLTPAGQRPSDSEVTVTGVATVEVTSPDGGSSRIRGI